MRSLLLVLAPVAVAACELPHDVAQTGQQAQPIIGGVTDTGDPSVVMLQTPGGGCTGALVSSQVILTAGHCVSDAIEDNLTNQGSAYFGPGGDDGFVDQIGVRDMVMYRLYEPPAFLQYDLAMIRLDEPAPDSYERLPINFDHLSDDYIGLPLRTVGFGATNGMTQEGFGTKRQIDLTLDELTYFHIGLGTQAANICQGDSGGPTFGRFGDEERIVGVSSYGSDQCQARSFITRTDIYQDWIETVMDAWDGPCQADGACVTEGCRTPDPDCDVCGFDGFCGEDCEAPDLDCELGARIGDECAERFDCESRVCLAAPDADVSYCSEECDPADGADACSPPLGSCVERDGRFVCEFNGPTPGTQGSACNEAADCRTGACDLEDDICVAPCGEGLPACPEGYECRAIGDGLEACRLPGDGGGCAVGGAAAGGWALAGLIAVLLRRRRRP